MWRCEPDIPDSRASRDGVLGAACADMRDGSRYRGAEVPDRRFGLRGRGSRRRSLHSRGGHAQDGEHGCGVQGGYAASAQLAEILWEFGIRRRATSTNYGRGGLTPDGVSSWLSMSGCGMLAGKVQSHRITEVAEAAPCARQRREHHACRSDDFC